MVETLFRDRTVSWVRIVNGIDTYVTETSETISLENVEHRVTGKLVAKAKPRPMPTVTLSPISIPVREKKLVRYQSREIPSRLFHSVISRDQITADMIHQFLEELMEQYDLTILWKKSRATFDGTSQWSINDWTTCLAKRGGPIERFQ